MKMALSIAAGAAIGLVFAIGYDKTASFVAGCIWWVYGSGEPPL